LVCSGANRGLDCPMNGRWRYDHFETAFLSFVEKLDLASLISTEQHQSKRAELSRQLEVTEGKQKRIERDLEHIFNTTRKMDDGSDFLARALREHEPQLLQAKQRREELLREIAELDGLTLAYYEDAGHMTHLIEQVRSKSTEDVYKIRARIASRLHSLIEDLQLMVAFDGDDDQQFEVNFHDGAHLMVFVDPADPAKILSVVREKDGLFIMTDSRGQVIDRYTMDEPGEISGA
jgi:hypothetical protein